MAWEMPIVADDDGDDAPVFVRIARAIAGDVDRGRLRPGDALPGSRTLARALGVHRNTVLAAVDELVAQGVVRTEPARRTVVAPTTTKPMKRQRQVQQAGFSVPPVLAPWQGLVAGPPGTLRLQSGVPDLRLLPVDEIARAWRRVVTRHGTQLLGYASPEGHEGLRTAIAHMLASTRGIPCTLRNILVVRGSQMGLDLCARTLVQPDDVVAVEGLGYPPGWRAMLSAGARLLPLPVDAAGFDVDALEAVVRHTRVRAVLLTPHRHYPTTVSLCAHRRRRLLALCARERIALIEDDYDHELSYEHKPLMPMKSVDGDGVVIYVGTLSKIVAPGLRLGFVCAPVDVIAALASLRAHSDRQGDLVLEAAVADLFDDGMILRHARRLKRAGQERRDAFVDALRSQLGDRLSFVVPGGGMALWAQVHDVDVEAWCARSLACGVSFATAQRYALDGRARPFVRLGFAALSIDELREAARRMKLAWRA